MQIKRIQCPKCKIVLDVKNSKDEEIKHISCPSCQSILQIKFPKPIEANTFYPPKKQPTADDGATQLSDKNHGTTELGGKTYKSAAAAMLNFGDVDYPLEEGENIVGRKGITSKATVQIATDDRYMSRQHCSITVTTLPDGTKKAVLSNYQNKNLTSIDGQEIETGDAIRLTDGNSITMGHTTITFKLS